MISRPHSYTALGYMGFTRQLSAFDDTGAARLERVGQEYFRHLQRRPTGPVKLTVLAYNSEADYRAGSADVERIESVSTGDRLCEVVVLSGIRTAAALAEEIQTLSGTHHAEVTELGGVAVVAVWPRTPRASA